MPTESYTSSGDNPDHPDECWTNGSAVIVLYGVSMPGTGRIADYFQLNGTGKFIGAIDTATHPSFQPNAPNKWKLITKQEAREINPAVA